ncbi:MAG: hypothetical protein AAGD09_25150, partial [Cyanobacteria bacterium P01_F01_bin.56]
MGVVCIAKVCQACCCVQASVQCLAIKHDLASYEQRKIEAQIYKGFTLRLFMEFQAVGNVIALFQIFFFQNIP